MAVTEVLEVVVDAGRHGHPGAARRDHLVVSRGPELAHVQAVVGEAPVDRHDELRGPGPEQPLQQLHGRSALRLVAGRRLEVVQCGELTRDGHKHTEHDDQNRNTAAPG